TWVCSVNPTPPCSPAAIPNTAGRFYSGGTPVPGSPSIFNSHGTFCAGIVAAEQNNGIGISGIAHEAKIIPVRVFYDHPAICLFVSTDVWMADGINWAINTANADVINI